MAIFTVQIRQASNTQAKVFQCQAGSIVEAAGQFRNYKIESITRITGKIILPHFFTPFRTSK